MYAIIVDGGRQYKVEEGQTLEIDFRSVDLNIPIRFPFTMPDGLTEIQLD